MFGICKKKKLKQTNPCQPIAKHDILILGAGESGKTTLVKQLMYLYGQFYGPEKRKQYVSHIFENLVNGIQCLVQNCDPLSAELEDLATKINSKNPYDDLSTVEADYISQLWRCTNVQECWKTKKADLQLPDGLDYLLSRAHIICQAGYVPTHDDILRVRKRTTGIVETTFKYNTKTITVIDVGGQKNERKKWIHAFDRCSTIIFIVALPCFDQKMWEDFDVNRMQDAFDLFSSVINMDVFIKKDIVLFLNKKDIFRLKVKEVNLKNYFDDYDGRTNSYADGIEYLTNKFLSFNENTNRKIFIHTTDATDPANIENSFTDVMEILNKNVVAL